MDSPEIVTTALGDVEIARVDAPGPPVLFFPGGHCSACVDCGWELYAGLGHSVVAFSRPGYGRTQVGDLSALEFMPAVEKVCAALGLTEIAAVVGVSYGALQAVPTASSAHIGAKRLILHSGAPSTLPYPDSTAERIAGPVVFGPRIQHATWAAITRLAGTESGLRALCAPLSTLPVEQWWPSWKQYDRERARTMFRTMSSDRGFGNDLRQSGADSGRYRRWLLQRIACPTLITGSRHDGGVRFAHAEDFAAAIPGAKLVALDSPTHLFWIGPEADSARQAVRDFLTTT
ncbi:alpha/beta hydrolase [Kribbella sp. NBC_00709]|uniref:alpha/beta fold hydrolase n=1 Tax=Kribbella sp. NBC_00709 TaxID=2975972 RepID=UPI002E2993F3|nr:alpha/beta hydrolase [Kribbella sp. NBC_00709]